jgi:flagellar biosynthesis activator protein FlaF
MKRRQQRMPELGLNAYRRTAAVISTGRDLEANVLTKAAQHLRDCQAKWGEEGHGERLDNALRLNQRIWTIIQSELTGDDNPLPIQVRNDILNLSLFVDKRIIEIMAVPAPEKLDIIIRININIAEGLRGSDGRAESDPISPSDDLAQSTSRLHAVG